MRAWPTRATVTMGGLAMSSVCPHYTLGLPLWLLLDHIKNCSETQDRVTLPVLGAAVVLKWTRSVGLAIYNKHTEVSLSPQHGILSLLLSWGQASP